LIKNIQNAVEEKLKLSIKRKEQNSFTYSIVNGQIESLNFQTKIYISRFLIIIINKSYLIRAHMEKEFEESAETAQESQEEVTQPIQSAEIFSESSEDGPEKQTDVEKIDPSELSKLLGLPSWVKVWVSEDKEEEEWTVTYSIPNKPELIEDIEGIR
jgi:hypothetical protein